MLGTLKVIPMALAFLAIVAALADFTGYDCSVLSMIGGVSFLPLLFIYLASYVFRFCEYHRMFLHYVVANNAITLFDFYVGIPASNRVLLMVHLILIGLLLYLVLYFYRRERCYT